MDFICPLCKCVRMYVRTYVQMYVPDKMRILIMSGHKSKPQKMDLFISGHKSKPQKMGYLYPIVDPAKNKIWIIYVRIQVKIAKDGFELCPDTSQNRKG